MLFQDWTGLGRTLLVGLLAYVGLVVLLRVSGKRTLTKLNAFDLVVTVALGSTLATILLSEDVALAEGLVAFAVLVGAQYVVTKLSLQSEAVRRFAKADPALLVLRGELLPAVLERERVSEQEVLAAVRSEGLARVEDAFAVVLETDGSFSVIAEGAEPPSALRTVRPEPRGAGARQL
jgi:uncharacterized membrane protein YcaP (DUF421 family)